jgi:hypothetical protein
MKRALKGVDVEGFGVHVADVATMISQEGLCKAYLCLYYATTP